MGQCWLLSAKLARKAGYEHTAYSALLQAERSKSAFTVIESAKLARIHSGPVRALQELDNYYHLAGPVIDLTQDDDEKRFQAKVRAASYY